MSGVCLTPRGENAERESLVREGSGQGREKEKSAPLRHFWQKIWFKTKWLHWEKQYLCGDPSRGALDMRERGNSGTCSSGGGTVPSPAGVWVHLGLLPPRRAQHRGWTVPDLRRSQGANKATSSCRRDMQAPATRSQLLPTTTGAWQGALSFRGTHSLMGTLLAAP